MTNALLVLLVLVVFLVLWLVVVVRMYTSAVKRYANTRVELDAAETQVSLYSQMLAEMVRLNEGMYGMRSATYLWTQSEVGVRPGMRRLVIGFNSVVDCDAVHTAISRICSHWRPAPEDLSKPQRLVPEAHKDNTWAPWSAKD